MKHSESLINIAPALVKAQAEIKNSLQTADNPYYKSTYAPLDVVIDDVRPVLNKHGIAILQDVFSSGDDVIISTMLLHVSGEWIQQEGMRLPMEKVTPQGAGSAVTYGRRYTLPMMTGTATEKDDDGNAAEKTAKQNGKKADIPKPEVDPAKVDLLKALPEDVKEGLRLLGWPTTKIIDFCALLKWQPDVIKQETSKLLDAQNGN